ncbi:MAG: hypothetical protein WB608_17135, partial [Terracidiphilus sp.]
MTTTGWDGDRMVYTGYMVRNDQKLPAMHSFLKKGDHRYDSRLEISSPDGKALIVSKKPAERSANATFERFFAGTS